MIISNQRQKYFGEFEELGEAAVEAKLAQSDVNSYQPRLLNSEAEAMREWLILCRLKREKNQREDELKNIQKIIHASWALVGITLVFVVATWWGIYLQKEDNIQQQKNAKSLLGMQISVELDKQFESLSMRGARRRIATLLMNNKVTPEITLPLFLDKLGLYVHQNLIDRDTVYHSYVYWVERYWPVLKPSVEKFRKQQKDPSYLVQLEQLYDDMRAMDADKGLTQPSKEEILRFLKEEADLPK